MSAEDAATIRAEQREVSKTNERVLRFRLLSERLKEATARLKAARHEPADVRAKVVAAREIEVQEAREALTAVTISPVDDDTSWLD